MNHKEALKEVKDQLINAGDYEDMYWDCVPTAILEVLEKQIPKQVKK